MRRLAATFLLVCIASSAHSASVTIGPIRDNTVYEEATGNSNGAGDHVFAGATGTGNARRAFIAFDVAGSVPAGAVIDSVVLVLNMSRTSLNSGSHAVALHRVLADWGEAGSSAFGNEGAGAAAQTGDVTWSHRFWNTQAWSVAGGQFAAGASATRPVNAVGTYAWRSAGMTADVQSWLDTPATNFGWVLMGNESGFSTAKRFDSKENVTAAVRPKLTIHYTQSPTGVGATPVAAMRLAASPNPFGGSTTLRFELDGAQPVTLAVYDARGRMVQRIASGPRAAGTHEAAWHGTDERGARVASGVYFARLESPGRAAVTRRVVLLR